MIRVSSLTKPSVTQFCRFTTMSSHVPPTQKKKRRKKKKLQLCSQLTPKGRLRGACSFCNASDPAARCPARLEESQSQQTDQYHETPSADGKPKQNKVPQVEGERDSSWKDVSHLVQPKMGLAGAASLKTPNLAASLCDHPSLKFLRRPTTKAAWNRTGIFCTLNQVFRFKFLFPVMHDTKATAVLSSTMPHVFRPRDLITVSSNWHTVLNYKY